MPDPTIVMSLPSLAVTLWSTSMLAKDSTVKTTFDPTLTTLFNVNVFTVDGETANVTDKTIVPSGIPTPCILEFGEGGEDEVNTVLLVVALDVVIGAPGDGGVYAVPKTFKSSGNPGPNTELPTTISLTSPDVLTTLITLVV